MTALRICFVGDSITNGTLDADYLGWPGRICAEGRSEGHDLTCYNLGVRADTSDDIRRRWRAECEARLPSHVSGALVFAFGVNDTVEQVGSGLRVPAERSVENAREIIAAGRDWLPTLWVGPAPAEMTMQPLKVADTVVYRFANERVAALNGAYADLAAELDVPYLDMYTPLAADPRWSAALRAGDGVHPTAAGYMVMADLIRAWPAWQAWFVA